MWPNLLLNIATFAFLCPVVVLANVGFFDNSGAGLTLGKTDKIQMVSEVVEITFTPADGPVTGNLKHRDKAHYNCRFILRNLADKSVTAQVGFPVIGEGVTLDPQEHPEAQAELLAYYGFSVQSGDDAYPVRYQLRDDKNGDSESNYRHLFVWNMEFPPARNP